MKPLVAGVALYFAFMHAAHVSKYLTVADYVDSIGSGLNEFKKHTRDNSTCNYAIIAEVTKLYNL